LDATEKAAEDGQLKGVKEEGQGGLGGEEVAKGVSVVEGDGRELGGVRGALPDFDIGEGDAGESAVELNAFDAQKGEARGEQAGAAFAGANVKKDGLGDRRKGREALQPEIEKRLQDAGGDTVVGSEFCGLDGGAASNFAGGDEAGGVGAVELIEGMNNRFAGMNDGLEFFARHSLQDREKRGKKREVDAGNRGQAEETVFYLCAEVGISGVV